MTEAERVQDLAALLEGTSISLLELTGPEGTFRLRREASSSDSVLAALEDGAERVVAAPSAGTFRTHHPLESAPLAQLGRPVDIGDVVGLIEVGTLLIHLRAPVAGVIAEMLAEEGAMVGYGTPLIRLAEVQP